MQGGRNSFFGFGDPFGSFGNDGGLMSSFFGGSDPFDDPFFARPFGSMFQSSIFGSTRGPFMNPNTSGFLENHLPSHRNRSRGPIIEELSSDDEESEKKSEHEMEVNPRKHGRSGKEPFVEHPDDEVAVKKTKHMPRKSEINQMQHVRSQPQSHSLTFQSSSVSYGGANGTFYTSSRTRREGSDGLTFEECKEADSSTRQATHRVSRGIHEKGHSITRKLKSDGHVDTMQTLHNVNEDELGSFEEAWKGNARKNHLGLPEGFVTGEVMGSGCSGQQTLNRGGGCALPSTEMSNSQGIMKPRSGEGAVPLPRKKSGRRMKPDLK